jgi:peptide/nickel transport system substrate-binding protein
MVRDGFGSFSALALVAGLLAPRLEAQAQTRAETLRQVTGNVINTLDPTMPGATREAFGLSMNVVRLAA